ncbi:MAG: ABC transporter permease [Alphaproteobacteria bacterium]|nr:ABC transporter permease [Alphaproteobacteria bacterium]TAD90286.1 MAG: ABC transporter permease [Alphaproteobacteria bacterium]
MQAFLVKRLGVGLITLWVVTVLVFSLIQLLPGDVALALSGEERDPAAMAYVREKYHLDQPVLVQYLYWMGDALRGEFGTSLKTNLPVDDMILSKIPVTLQLAVFSMIWALGIGIPAGVLSALYKSRWPDHLANAVGLSGLSIPNFWLGILLILVFAVELQWLPPGGYVPLSEDPWENLASMLMPSFVLGSGIAAVIMRHTRSAMLGALGADYVRTARAKGLAEKVVIIKHALRNALMPVITLGALEFGQLLSGAVLTEQVFNIPGFGKLIVDAVFTRDFQVVQGAVLFTATMYIALNLLADLAYYLVNPRLRG